MIKSARLPAILLTAVILLTACGGGAAGSAAPATEGADDGDWTTRDVTITFLHSHSEEAEQTIVSSTAFREMIDIYQARHPNVVIEELRIADNYDTLMLQYAAADDLPMMFRFLYANLDTIAGGGLAADITEYVDPSIYIDNLYGTTYKDGRIYGLNMKFTDYNIVYYNEAMLREATGSTQFPTSWDEYLALDEYFDTQGIDLISLGNEGRWFAVVGFFNALANEFCGEDFSASMIEGRGDHQWTEEGFIRAVEQAARVAPVCNADFNSLDDVSAIGNYCAGKAFSTVYGSWVTSTILLYADEYPDVVNNTRCAIVPSYSGSEEDCGLVYASTETYGINAGVAEGSDEFQACLALIRQLCSEDYAVYMAERGNIAPVAIDTSGIDLSTQPQMIQDFMDIHNYGYTPVQSYFTYLPTAINDQFLIDSQLVLAGQMTAEQMAQDMQRYQDDYALS